MSGFFTSEPWAPEPVEDDHAAFVRSIRCSFCGHVEPGGSLLGHYSECADYPAVKPVRVLLGASSRPYVQGEGAALAVAKQHELQKAFKW